MQAQRGNSTQNDSSDLNSQIQIAYFEQIRLALRDGLKEQLAGVSRFNFYKKYQLDRCLSNLKALDVYSEISFANYEYVNTAAVTDVLSGIAKRVPDFFSAQDANEINIFIARRAEDRLSAIRTAQAEISVLSTAAAELISHPMLNRRLTNLHTVLAVSDSLQAKRETQASTQLIGQALFDENPAPVAKQSQVDAWQIITKNVADIMNADAFKEAAPLRLSFLGKLKKLWQTYHPEGYQPVRQSVSLYSPLKNAVLDAQDPAAFAQAVAAFKAPWYEQGKLPNSVATGFQQLDDYVALAKHNHLCSTLCQQLEEEDSSGNSAGFEDRPSTVSRHSKEGSRWRNHSFVKKSSVSDVDAAPSYVSFKNDENFRVLSQLTSASTKQGSGSLLQFFAGSQAVKQCVITGHQTVLTGR